MTKKWIAIVNRTEARIFNAEDMRKIYTLRNPLGREKNRSFTADKPGLGRNRSLSKGSIHNLTGEKSPHNEAAKKFAHKLNIYLRKRFHEHRFDTLLLSAEPRMQGWIKSGMQENLKKRSEWKPKDLAKLSDHELKALFLGKEAVWPRKVTSQSGS